MKQKHKISDEVYIEAYNRLKTLGKVALELNVPDVTVWRRCKKLGLEFKNGGQNKGNNVRFETKDILEGKHPQYSTLKLKNRLLKEKILDEKCSLCGIIDWKDKKLSFQLDHIDGNNHNNVLENLRILCPNCHSQTDTYCGRNK